MLSIAIVATPPMATGTFITTIFATHTQQLKFLSGRLSEIRWCNQYEYQELRQFLGALSQPLNPQTPIPEIPSPHSQTYIPGSSILNISLL